MKESDIISSIKKIYNDSILKNSVYLMMTSLCSIVFGFFFWVVATRYYTPSDVGIVSAVLSSIFLISMVSSIGMPNALLYYLPRYTNHVNRIINSCLTICILISTIISIIFILNVDIFAPQLKSIFGDIEVVIIFIATTVMMTVSSLIVSMYSAGKRSSFRMIKENIFNISKIFLIILFANIGIMGIFLSWVLGLIISTITGFFLLSKLWKYTPAIVIDPIVKNMASFSIENYIASIFYNLPKQIFPIMIVSLISAESAGYFFIAMTVANVLYNVPLSISTSFLAESSDKKKFHDNVEKAIKFNTLILIPGILLFIIFGEYALNIFGQRYINSFDTLVILSVTSIPLSLISIFGTVMIAQNRVRTVIKINMAVAIMTIVLSMYLMKIWSIEGIAISHLIANTVVALAIISKMRNPVEFTLKIINGNKRLDILK